MTTARRLTLIVAALLVAAGVAGVTWAWDDGHRPFAVRSGSMAPTFGAGDLIIVRPASVYAPGDAITFRDGAFVTTHRVVGIEDGRLVTQGDANDEPDAATVAPEDVVGRVVALVPSAGYVLVFFQQPTGLPSLVTSLLGLTALWSSFFPSPDGGRPTGSSPVTPRTDGPGMPRHRRELALLGGR
nr:signal peptidase I [uncultured Actinotalea sp.]